MNNIKYLLSIKKLKSISVNPMIPNWKDIPKILQFCQDNELNVYFNDVITPLGGYIKGIHENGKNDLEEGCVPKQELIPEFCLHTLPVDKLNEIINHYESFSFNDNLQFYLTSLINRLKRYILEKSN
jgi:hypothetical protein